MMPEKRMVEAAGVEPASEKACRMTTTCVSGSKVSTAALGAGKMNSGPARLISAWGYGQKP
jgi:hypothetical protein